MIRANDVNMAMIRQAAAELEVNVPIRAWEVVDGELVLHLAYGRVARWKGPGDLRSLGRATTGRLARTAGESGTGERPWRFVEANRKAKAPPLPGGSLKKKTRQQLLNVALDWGFQSTSGYVTKAELVEALDWLRAGGNDDGGE